MAVKIIIIPICSMRRSTVMVFMSDLKIIVDIIDKTTRIFLVPQAVVFPHCALIMAIQG